MPLDPGRFALKNRRLMNPTLPSGGQPDSATLKALKSAGMQHIVNLRAAEEVLSLDNAATAFGLGLSYHALPISGPAGLTRMAAIVGPLVAVRPAG